MKKKLLALLMLVGLVAVPQVKADVRLGPDAPGAGLGYGESGISFGPGGERAAMPKAARKRLEKLEEQKKATDRLLRARRRELEEEDSDVYKARAKMNVAQRSVDKAKADLASFYAAYKYGGGLKGTQRYGEGAFGKKTYRGMEAGVAAVGVAGLTAATYGAYRVAKRLWDTTTFAERVRWYKWRPISAERLERRAMDIRNAKTDEELVVTMGNFRKWYSDDNLNEIVANSGRADDLEKKNLYRMPGIATPAG